MKKITRYTIVTMLLLGLLASAISVQAADVVTVGPSDMGGTPAVGGWGFANEGSATGGFGFSVGPVDHSGSLKLTTSVTTDGPYFAGLFAGFNLPGLTTLKYDAYSVGATGSMPTLQLDVDYDSTIGTPTWQGRLVFVPNGPFTPGTWTTFDALSDTDGIWFGTGGDGATTCSISAPCAWSAVEAAFPNLVVFSTWSQGVSAGSGAIGFKKGSGDAAPFEGYVDNLVIDSTTYDFEPASDIYVNAIWAGTALGTDPDSAGPAHAFGADAFATIEEGAVAVPVNGTVHVASGTYVLGSQIAMNKAGVTLEGAGSASTVIQVSGTGERFFITTPGVTIEGFHIEKTDKTGVQNIVYIGASNVTIQNNEFSGQYVFGDGDVSRAMVFTGGLSGVTITNNTIHDLRQPAYISGVTTGTISNNYVYLTRGWVVEQGNMTFTNNTWGTDADANVYDIVILSGVNASYYTDIPAMSAANNDAFIEDQRTSPATLSIVYVDDSVVSSGTGTATSPKKTIAEGITRVVTGGTIHVAAGTYKEEPVINKALTLLGPNASVNPNTGTRGEEAVIQPVTQGTDPFGICTVILYVSADDVTIDGLTIDGDNPDLTSGVLVNGVDVDACEGIAGWDGSANMVVENNIVKNTTYTGIDFDNYNVPGSTAGNYIRYNLLNNIGNSTIGYGIGVLVYNNFYADITNNVFTDVRVGIQTGNYHLANPGTTGRISNNEIHSWRAGIFHNLFYSGASDIPVSNNTISVIDSTGTTRWNGILFTSFSVPATISNNTITATDVNQQTVGYMVWNDLAPSGLTLSDGSVSGADYGVWVNNYQGYGPSSGGPTAITIDGLTISNASLAGIYVQDDSENTNFATVDATIVDTQISGSTVAVKVGGSDASADGSFNQFAGNDDGVVNTTASLVDFRKNWWGNASGPGPVGPGTGDGVSSDVDYTPWCANAACTLFAPLPLTSLSMEQSPTGGAPWSPASGNLGSGYLLSLNGVPADFVYLNVDSLTLTTTLKDGYHPFMLDTASLPGDFYTYWDSKGVNAGAVSGSWQAEMYQIILGNDPIFYLKVAGTTYSLVDGLGHNMGWSEGYLRISGDYPLGTYTFDGILTDTIDATYAMTADLTAQPLPEITALSLEQSPTGSAPWSPITGSLGSDYQLPLNGMAGGFVYLDVDSLTSLTTLKDGYHPFWLDTASVPSDFSAYWDAKGVNAVAVLPDWQAYMWQIVNGNEPIFYLKVTGSTYTLIDGLGKLMGGPDGNLRISTDYPLGTYAFDGELKDTTDATNAMTANLTTSLITYAISGNADVGGTTITYTGGSTTADLSGDYSFTVPYNWSGTVTPSMTGYTFTPSSITYSNVTAHQVGQDYTAAHIPPTISGNVGVAGATITYTGGSTTSDASGAYTFTVPYDWSGTVTPTKAGYVFTPPSRTYANVQVNQTSQNFGISTWPSWYGAAVIQSDFDVIALGSPYIGSEIASFEGFNSGSTTMYVPMLFKQMWGNYDSALYIQNTDATNQANITIKFYDPDGVLNCTKTDIIPSGSSHGYWLPFETCLPANWYGGAVVTSDRDIVAVGRPHIGDQVLTYNGFASGSLAMYVPMLFKQMWGYDSAFYVQNTDPANAATVTIKFYDPNGVLNCTKTDVIPRLSSHGYWLPYESCLPANWYGGVVVTSDREIVAVGRPHLGGEIAAYNGFASGSTVMYAPVLFSQANGGSDDSALYIQNVHDTNTANVTITFYDTAGNVSCTQTDTISHGSSKGYWLPSLTCLPVGWEGSVKVDSNQPVAVIGRPHLGSSVNAYDGMVSGGLIADVPMLFKQMWGNYDSMLYIENVDSVNTASVTTKFYDVDGNLSCVRTDTIDPLATLSYWLPDLTCSP